MHGKVDTLTPAIPISMRNTKTNAMLVRAHTGTSREHTAVNTSGIGANTLPSEDGSVFEMLNEIIQYEPTELFSPELLGRLATLGIEKGKPFAPDGG